jgi:GMP synthase (glutamine-hydrolysing)
MTQKKILILDYSFEKIEAPTIRRWLPEEADVTALFIDTAQSFPDDLAERGFTHVVHSGSSLSITQEAPFTKKAVSFIRDIRENGAAQFGICYGHQLVCFALVGKHAVRSSPNGLEVGWCDLTFTDQAMNVLGVGQNETIFQYHFDEVVELPKGSELLATNSHTAIQAYINRQQSIIGTQFHPEFDKEAGNKLFLDDREFLARHQFDADDITSKGPSIEAGKLFFGYFLQVFK